MDQTRDVAAVVLAAGESRRFGGRKQLARLEGRTLLEHVLLRADAAGLRPVIAVVPVWLTLPARAPDDVVWVRNPAPELGLSHSLTLGLAAVPERIGAAVILLGDQPTVAADQIAALLAVRGERPMVASTASGILAPPLLIERSHFGVVEQLQGDLGLREVLGDNPDWVATVEVGAHVPDIDTLGDLSRLVEDR